MHSAGRGEEADPRAELVRRLQEYERFKRAAEGIDRHAARLERDTWVASAELVDRKVVRIAAAGHAAGDAARLPGGAVAQRHVRAPSRAARAAVGAPAHDRRAVGSERRAPSWISCACSSAEEGRRGVTVTFVAILELLREGLIEIVQSEAYAPLHVRLGNPARRLKLVTDER